MKGFLYWSAYNNIVETLHMDAAPGRLRNGDGGACGNSLAKASREAQATPELFVACARQFLSTADARTCRIDCHDPAFAGFDLGFKVRRYGDFLYVTEAAQDDRLKVGMRIAAVGKNTVPFLLKDLGCDVFWGRGTDREDWDLALRMFQTVDVFPGDGHVVRLDLRHFPVQPTPPRLCWEKRSDAVVLTIESLEDPHTLEALLEDARSALLSADRLVVDLRRCPGQACAQAWLALLPWLCDRSVDARDVMGDEHVWTIYSKANAKRLLEGVQAARSFAQAAGDATTCAALDELAQDVQAKAAAVLEAKRSLQGLQERRAASEVAEVVPSPFANERIEVPEHAPQRAILLVDAATGEGAERLAQASMGMQKIRLAGRATPGAVDYANYATTRYPDISASLTYPISRTTANREGRGFARTGLPLDLHVPWTPEECERDAVLERALLL